MISSIPFFFEPLSAEKNGFFHAHPRPDIHKTQQLLEALYQVLWLPGYFGFNWDALDDCLNDLSWIQEEKIILHHEKLPKIPEIDLKIYLEILRDAVFFWKQGGSNRFEVVFDEEDRDRVIDLLRS